MNDENLQSIIASSRFEFPRNQLQAFLTRSNRMLPSVFWNHLSETKQQYVDCGDQSKAKAVWCLEIIGSIQDDFIATFQSLKKGDYKNAWDCLERCENLVVGLDRHFADNRAEFGVEHVRRHTHQLQQLFPLKWGISPGYLNREVLCSVCETKRGLRSNCGHINGEIYDGIMCHDKITKMEILHIALVDSPAQRYSVIWPENEDGPEFKMLRHLVHQLADPWISWTYDEEIRREYHPAYAKLNGGDRCACSSELIYEDCCMQKDTVPHFPHFQFTIINDPIRPISNKTLPERLTIRKGN